MKNSVRKLSIVAAVCALAACLALVACGSTSTSGSTENSGSASSEVNTITEGTITVGASLDFPPFENLDTTTSEPVGFDIDIMQALCDDMGYQMNFLPTMKFDTLVPSVVTGSKIDCSISGITITPEREAEVDFTDPYYDSNQAIVVMKDGSYTTVDQLKGKKIGAQSGTTGYDWAIENISGSEVIAFDEATAAFAALQAGQVDAVSIDLPVATEMINNGYSNTTIIQQTPTGEQYGIAVNKNNPGLTAAFNQALKNIKANGTYDEIYNKWFGIA